MPLSPVAPSADTSSSPHGRVPVEDVPAVGVVVAHPIPLLRMGLTDLLRSVPGAVLLACEDNSPDMLGALRRHRPELAVIAPEFEAEAVALRQPVRLMLVSQHEHAGRMLTEPDTCAFAGGRASIEMLLDTMRRMVACVQQRDATRPCLRCQLRRSLVREPLPLSPREQQVFEMIGSGRITSQIAQALGVSVKTVETYRANIKCKLGLDSSAALTGAATLWGKGIHPLRAAH